MAKLMLGWLLILAAIICGARWIWHDNSKNQKPLAKETPVRAIVSQEDAAFLNEAGPLCHDILVNFLAAGTPEERNQSVLTPITTAARMASFYSMNPLVSIDPQTLRFSKAAILNLPAGRSIETYWNTTEGHQLDAVFTRENGEWRLDWDHFARFSDYPWALFLAGSGEDQAEFRLLARERLANERKGADAISIVLYAPRFGDASGTGFQSPEFLIPRSSKNGRLLDAAFKLEKSGERVFGVNLPSINSEGLIRVRVKVRRTNESTERRFVLEDVVACHWYSVDAPGVEIPDQPREK